MSPAERMRALQVLHGPAKTHLHEPEKLKYLLAPVLTKSPADQQRFYDIFDRFFEEAVRPLPVPDRPSFWERWGVLVISLLLIAVAGLAVMSALKRINRPDMEMRMPQEGYVLGDTLLIETSSEKVKPQKHQFRWELIDLQSGAAEKTLLDSTRWEFTLDTLGAGPEKQIRLQLLHRQKQNVLLEETATLIVRCPDPPVITELIFDPAGNIGDTITFAPVIKGEGPFEYQWDLDAGREGRDSVVTATYNRTGIYQIELRVTTDPEKGLCEAVSRSTLQIGIQASPPPYKPLERDELAFTAAFTGWYWSLLALLALVPGYFLIRWLRRPKEEPEEEAPTEAVKAPDKPPYFIPFQSQNARIQVGQEQFLLANAMRIRQEGLRKEVDVPTSIRKTIDRGGFPNLEFRYSTQPTEYLILIDEHSPQSHQARLFQYFAHMLREQDVLLNIFYYHTDLNRLWNAQFPKGICLEVLQRQYPLRRLVIMGDAHGLIDPHARGAEVLRSHLLNTLKRWPHRLLLTPLPPRSWSYEEDALHEFFVIFPADLRGLADAAVFLESGQIDEEIEEAPFLPWQQKHEQIRQDPEAEFRNWKRLDTHREYLKDHPELYTWLCALAVYPSPTWELSIAIGEALKPLGVEVTIDNLLILSRIPWLQKGHLHPRLRKEMLDELDEYPESLAREAVARELDAVSEEVAGGQVSGEWESNLAVQQFALSPFDEEVRSKVRDLWKKGLLSNKQVGELNKTMQRRADREARMKKGSFAPERPDVREILQEKEERQETSRPLLRPAFWRFAASTLVLALLFLGSCNLNKTDLLYRLAFSQDEPEAAWLVGQTVEADSALLLNNEGVNLFYETLREYEKRTEPVPNNLSSQRDPAEFQLPAGFEDAEAVFNYALQFNPNYELAQNNLARLYYNLGTIWLGRIMQFGLLDEQKEATSWYNAYINALDPPESLDGYHGRGLAEYYQRNYQQADTLLGICLAIGDQKYFDTLSYRPNLRDLLNANIPLPDRVKVDSSLNLKIPEQNIRPLNIKPIEDSLRQIQILNAERISIEITGQLVSAEMPDIKLNGTVSLVLAGQQTLFTESADDDGRFTIPFMEVRADAPLTLVARAVGFEVMEIPLGSQIDRNLPKQALKLGVIKLIPKGPEKPPIEQPPEEENEVEIEISVRDFSSGSPLSGVQMSADPGTVSKTAEEGIFLARVNPEEEFTLRLQKAGYVNRDMTFRDGQYVSETPQNVQLSLNATGSNVLSLVMAQEQPDVSVYFDVNDQDLGLNSYADIYEKYVGRKKRIVNRIRKNLNPKIASQDQAESVFSMVEEGFRDLQNAASYMRQLLDAGYTIRVRLRGNVSGKTLRDPNQGLFVQRRMDSVVFFFNDYGDGKLFEYSKTNQLSYRSELDASNVDPASRDLDDYDPSSIGARRVNISFDIRPPEQSPEAAGK